MRVPGRDRPLIVALLPNDPPQMRIRLVGAI
jgi:hypothetical protein